MLLTHLNTEQKEAVELLDTPLMILAGPGTGKTKTLTYKIAYLLDKRIPPNTILALTFTRKAAQEMQERVQKLISRKTRFPFIGTFHSFAYEFLKKHDMEIKLISENDRQEIIKHLKKKFKLTASLKELSLEISNLKSRRTEEKTDYLPDYVTAYNEILISKELFDYEDLLLQLLHYLKNNPKVKFDYLYVDEFQDTNDIQYQLITALNRTNNVCVIGDPLQSIYSFRGSSMDIFKRFAVDFHPCRTILLKNNYRSGEKIISAGHSLFPSSNKLITMTSKPGEVCLVNTLNEYSEADWIVTTINERLGGLDLNLARNLSNDTDQSARFSDFAVIYRTHNLKDIVKDKLHKSGIPYQIIGDGNPFEEKNIKLLSLSLKYLAEENPVYLNQLSKILKEDEKIISSKLASVEKNTSLSQIIKDILVLYSPPIDISNSLHEFVNSALPYNKLPGGLNKFTKYLTYLEEHEYYDGKADKVTLLTMHAAKGLEFTHVFILGFEEGLVPFKKADDTQFDEEEKRLLYVAITRAKRTLHLTTTMKRYGRAARNSPFRALLKNVAEEIIDPTIRKVKTKYENRKVKQGALFN